MFDKKLKEGVEYFEQMLKVMPDDRQALEFLVVAYQQLNETEKYEHVLADLARVLLKLGDSESAAALVDRLESASLPAAKAMALRVRAAGAPKPELVPEGPSAADLEAENVLAGKAAEAKEDLDAYEHALAAEADANSTPPIPFGAFEPDRNLVRKLDAGIVRFRGIVPFAAFGSTVLVACVSTSDGELLKSVERVLGRKCFFFLASAEEIDAAVKKIYPEEEGG